MKQLSKSNKMTRIWDKLLAGQDSSVLADSFRL